MKVSMSIALLAAAVSAQTTSSSGSTACAALNILEACLQTTQGYLSLCATNDWSCYCDKYTAIMTCFDNCPNDSRASGFSNQKIQYCVAASQYASTTTAKSTTGTGTTAAATTSADATKTEGTAASATTSGSEAESTKNSAADIVLNAGSLLAAVAGVVAAVL